MDEVTAALMSDDPETALEALQVSGKLEKLLPEVQEMVGFGGLDEGHKDLWGHVKAVVARTPREPLLRWAALFHDVGKVDCYARIDGKVTFHGHEAESAKLFRKAMDRLRFLSREETERVRFLVRNLGYVESYEKEWTDSAVRRLMRDVGMGVLGDLVRLSKADVTSKHLSKREAVKVRMDELWTRANVLEAVDATPPALPKGLGDAIAAELGIRPGPELGRVMSGLKAMVEAGELPRGAEFSVYLAKLKE